MKPSDLRVVICYKNFAAITQGISHIGLGVSAVNNAKCLHAAGVRTEILAMKYETDLRTFLNKQSATDQPVTHVIVSAPWMSTSFFQWLCSAFPRIKFAMNCHSNVGFLQADTNGIRLIREGLALESATHNFTVAGNSKRFCNFIVHAYGNPCAYLPNMYYLDGSTNSHRPSWHTTRGILRIGVFGATRSQKNFITSIAAAIEISRELKAQTEVWINTERADGPESKRILAAAKMLVDGLPNITLKYAGWQSWPSFKKLVGNMHLLIQISTTESFNICTADGCSEGVPTIVSDAITWAPKSWQAEVDDVFDVSRAGVRLLGDHVAAKTGLLALKKHNNESLSAWLRYLGVRKYNENAEFTFDMQEDLYA